MESNILDQSQVTSSKSYGIAVCLSAIFGILGIHHFYLERFGMGVFDLALSLIGFWLVISGNYWGVLFLGIDALHTIYVTYKLLVGEYADGDGRFVAYPGQKNFQQSKKL